jgi:hypothetical protein
MGAPSLPDRSMTNLPWYTASASSRTSPGMASARAARSSAELSTRSGEPALVPTAGGAGTSGGALDPVGVEAVGAVAIGKADGAGREGAAVVPVTELGRLVLGAVSGRDGVGSAATVRNRTS